MVDHISFVVVDPVAVLVVAVLVVVVVVVAVAVAVLLASFSPLLLLGLVVVQV